MGFLHSRVGSWGWGRDGVGSNRWRGGEKRPHGDFPRSSLNIQGEWSRFWWALLSLLRGGGQGFGRHRVRLSCPSLGKRSRIWQVALPHLRGGVRFGGHRGGPPKMEAQTKNYTLDLHMVERENQLLKLFRDSQMLARILCSPINKY